MLDFSKVYSNSSSKSYMGIGVQFPWTNYTVGPQGPTIVYIVVDSEYTYNPSINTWP